MIVRRRSDDAPAKARRRWNPWLALLLVLLVPMSCVAGLFLLIDGLALRALYLLSPDNVFFCTPTYPFYVLPELIISFPIGLMTPFLLLWMVPSFRSGQKKAAAELVPLIRTKWGIAMLGTYLFSVPVYLFALSSNVCLSDSEIYYRPNIFFPLQTYALSQIAEVRPRCTRGRKYWGIDLEITMTDESSFDLAAVAPVYRPSSERILGLLPKPLDTSEISRDCPIDLKKLITPR